MIRKTTQISEHYQSSLHGKGDGTT
uniref:Uncharacterized protein n=1 Tax=Rhizophora mucronata TaxID=61149 RepID=A0A2P2N989_RHIMU